jgi:hypothetical protein
MGGGGPLGVEKDTQTDDRDAGTHGVAVDRVGGQGERAVQALLAGGGGTPDPQRVAAVIRANPGERAAIMQLLNRTLGMGFANRVAQSMQPGPGVTDAAPIDPALADRVKATPEVSTIHLAGNPIVSADTSNKTRPDPDPHTRPAPLSNPSYLANYKLLGSQTTLDTYQATDKTDEAPLLNAIRASNHRFEPAWVLALQKRLHIRETGAFNTDTLRAIRTLLPAVKDADFLSDTHALEALVPGGGSPFRSIGSGAGALGMGSTERVSEPTHLADAGARALGYPSYAALHGDLTSIKFLGVDVRGRAHPHLAARLKLAEDWIVQRHGKDAKPADVGWGPTGKPDAVASYHDNVTDINANDAGNKGPHLHAYGVAIDFDPDHNPFVFDKWKQDPSSGKDAKEKQAIKDNNWWVEMFERQFALAAKIYGGEAITADKMATWSEQLSTEELFARIDQASKSFQSLLELGQYGSDQEIDDILITQLTMSAPDAKATKHELRGLAKKGYSANRFFKDFMGRDQAESLTTHSNELLIALRDVAGLAWGGTEMSHPVNGDFMHFDIRQDTLGQQAFNFAMSNRGVTTDPPATPADQTPGKTPGKTPDKTP